MVFWAAMCWDVRGGLFKTRRRNWLLGSSSGTCVKLGLHWNSVGAMWSMLTVFFYSATWCRYVTIGSHQVGFKTLSRARGALLLCGLPQREAVITRLNERVSLLIKASKTAAQSGSCVRTYTSTIAAANTPGINSQRRIRCCDCNRRFFCLQGRVLHCSMLRPFTLGIFLAMVSFGLWFGSGVSTSGG